ncbi:MAG: precorrin-3B C(17)-methyltransferase [SAR324 cluster bacterium]|nr:precorrin-3B C(17)-methyltransferase [SAR324 cluster bacterium]MBL7034437.1 precorrin-3B C(17)-methyltransferase [SAR324 cluster bacterium]
MNQRIVVFCLGTSALPLAKKIVAEFGAELHAKADRISNQSPELEVDVLFTDAMKHLEFLFREGAAIVGVCASAVLIRGVAGALVNKLDEPPVIAVAEDGSSVVPLLGGHHGANALARKIGKLIGVTPAVTTAGDLRFGIALDEPPQGFVLTNPEDVKVFTAELLAGAAVSLSPETKSFTPDLVQKEKTSTPDFLPESKTVVADYLPGFYEWMQESRLPFTENAKLRISLSTDPVSGNAEHLIFCPAAELPLKNVVVGVGCERGTEPKELISLVRKTLAENEIAPERVALVVSLDLKSDEHAVHALAAYFTEISGAECPARFFDAATLEAQTPDLQNPSEIVFQEVGCHGVAEGAALAAVAASGSSTANGKLLVAKIKSNRATCAVAEAENLLDPNKIGRAQGTLFIVGTGPGTPEWRLPEAEKMLRKSTDWVGYGLYLDLIADLHNGQKLHYFDLGQEEVRVRHALNLAAEGKTVALISSGDPGIYAMATLVFELLETGRSSTVTMSSSKEDSSLKWQRIKVEVTPGISALQAASARIGAPLGHDFCTISLSDLLTPWETIERRIRAAAEGDFVIAFYNPVSQRRATQLAQAKEILLKHRPAETPVVLARNLGRKEEQLRVVSLEKLDPTQVDMLTVVLVGSSQTRQLQLPNGEVRVYTPRGYADKTKD